MILCGFVQTSKIEGKVKQRTNRMWGSSESDFKREHNSHKVNTQYFNGHFDFSISRYSLSHFSSVHDGILSDNPHLVLLFYLSQLFLRELFKSYRLIQVVPMDMSGYYGE